MKQLLKPLDYVFVLRPFFMYAVWALFLAGFYSQSKFSQNNPNEATNHSLFTNVDNILLVGIFLTCLMGAVFILNQIMDRDKKVTALPRLIATGFLTPKSAFIEAIVLVTPALIFGFYFSIWIGVLFLVILLFMGIFYNFAPFKWKDKPIVALLMSFLSSFLIFSIGWMLRGQFSINLAIQAIPYAFLIAATYLLFSSTESGEEASEQTTFAAKFGLQRTLVIALIFEIIALVSAFLLKEELAFYPALFSLAVFIWVLIKSNRTEIVRAVKYPVFLLAAAVCIKWLITHQGYNFFFFLVGVYLVSKLYYNFRFES